MFNFNKNVAPRISGGGGGTSLRKISFNQYRLLTLLAIAILLIFPDAILAAPTGGGMSKATTALNGITNWVKAVTVPIAVLVIMWKGFKIIGGSETFREAAPVLISSVIFGAAGWLAEILFG